MFHSGFCILPFAATPQPRSPSSFGPFPTERSVMSALPFLKPIGILEACKGLTFGFSGSRQMPVTPVPLWNWYAISYSISYCPRDSLNQITPLLTPFISHSSPPRRQASLRQTIGHLCPSSPLNVVKCICSGPQQSLEVTASSSKCFTAISGVHQDCYQNK